MTLKTNTFDGGTAGTAVTTANSGTSGDAFGAVTPGLVYDDSQVMHGGLSAKLTTGPNYARYGYGSFQKFAARGYYRMGADGSTNELRPLTFLAANTSYAAAVVFRQDGWVLVKDSTGTNAYANNSGWQANTWYRIEMFVDIAAGSVQYAAYLGDSMTVFDSYSGTGMNYGTGNAVTAATFGNNSSVTDTMWVDSIAQNDAAAGLIGPYSMPTSPTVHLTSVTTNDGYTANTGSIIDALSDGSDATWVDGIGSLRGPLAPVDDGPLTLTAKADNTGGASSMTLNVYQGTSTTKIAGKTFTLTAPNQQFAYSLTTEENDAITDPHQLEGEIVLS